MKINELGSWKQFVQDFELSDVQSDQFQQYAELLLAWNKKMNLTAITDLDAIINLHFRDSLQIKHAIDMNKMVSVADVGTGAGFPGIPIKIMYPRLPLYLIEVNQKKMKFLHEVTTQLSLQNVELIDLDWRTFLRKADFSIDLFCARASLQPEELIRLFKPNSIYKNSTLVYWAVASWKSQGLVWAHVVREYAYTIDSKKRKLVVMQLQK